jgi:hypothetical protein
MFVDTSVAKMRVLCRVEVQRCLATMDCPQYFASVEERLAAEEERANSYLDATSSRPKLLDLLVDIFVTKQVSVTMLLSAQPCILSKHWGQLFWRRNYEYSFFRPISCRKATHVAHHLAGLCAASPHSVDPIDRSACCFL